MHSSLKMKIEDYDKDHKHQLIKFDGEFDKPGHSSVKDDLEDMIKNFQGTTIVFDFKKPPETTLDSIFVQSFSSRNMYMCINRTHYANLL